MEKPEGRRVVIMAYCSQLFRMEGYVNATELTDWCVDPKEPTFYHVSTYNGWSAWFHEDDIAFLDGEDAIKVAA